jgi:hypothetical protein
MGHKWNIGAWLDNRCQGKKKGVLDKVVETKMTDLCVEWVIKLIPEEWIFLLKAYTDKRGDCNIRQHHTETHMGRELKLGAWLSRQRFYKKKDVLDKVVVCIFTFPNLVVETACRVL